jgi:hypothetical protein
MYQSRKDPRDRSVSLLSTISRIMSAISRSFLGLADTRQVYQTETRDRQAGRDCSNGKDSGETKGRGPIRRGNPPETLESQSDRPQSSQKANLVCRLREPKTM